MVGGRARASDLRIRGGVGRLPSIEGIRFPDADPAAPARAVRLLVSALRLRVPDDAPAPVSSVARARLQPHTRRARFLGAGQDHPRSPRAAFPPSDPEFRAAPPG